MFSLSPSACVDESTAVVTPGLLLSLDSAFDSLFIRPALTPAAMFCGEIGKSWGNNAYLMIVCVV